MTVLFELSLECNIAQPTQESTLSRLFFITSTKKFENNDAVHEFKWNKLAAEEQYSEKISNMSRTYSLTDTK